MQIFHIPQEHMVFSDMGGRALDHVLLTPHSSNEPLQDHLSSGSGDYAFFISNNESDANDIIQGLGGRYVITDSTLAIGNFADLALWADNSRDLSPYTTQFVVPDKMIRARCFKGICV